MRRITAAVAALAGLALIATPAAANAAVVGSRTVQDAVFAGHAGYWQQAGVPTPGCTNVLPAAACTAVFQDGGFGHGGAGWPGHTSALGGPFVEPASFGFYYAGHTYNVYEALSGAGDINGLADALTQASGWFLPAGVNPAAFAASTVIPHNRGWDVGRGIIVPNDSGAPIVPQVPSVP